MLFEYLSQNTTAFISVVFILGLIFGSFFNVVIYRLPIMLKYQWRHDCQNFLSENFNTTFNTPGKTTETETFNLVTPDSTCPNCGHKIRAWENVPVISYLFLRGQCSNCHSQISIRYPVVELLTGVMAAFCAWKFGFSTTTLAAIILSWALICLALIDFDTQYLPDQITLPLLWIGLFANINHTFTELDSAVLGAISGYLVLWTVFQVFKLLTGKEGMGFGDFKLLAMLGAWLGWQMLPTIILLSSLVGSIVGVTMILFKNHQRNIPIPFGPYLAMAGWIAMMWGNEINQSYINWISN